MSEIFEFEIIGAVFSQISSVPPGKEIVKHSFKRRDVILSLTNPNGHGTIQQFGNVSVRQLVEHEKKLALCFRSVTYNLLRRQKRVDEICGHAQLVHRVKQSHRGRNVGQRDGHDVALFAAVFSERAAQRLHFVEELTVGYIAPDKMQGGFFSVVFLAFKKMPVHFSFN